jgi:hypothetical protein
MQSYRLHLFLIPYLPNSSPQFHQRLIKAYEQAALIVFHSYSTFYYPLH